MVNTYHPFSLPFSLLPSPFPLVDGPVHSNRYYKYCCEWLVAPACGLRSWAEALAGSTCPFRQAEISSRSSHLLLLVYVSSFSIFYLFLSLSISFLSLSFSLSSTLSYSIFHLFHSYLLPLLLFLTLFSLHTSRFNNSLAKIERERETFKVFYLTFPFCCVYTVRCAWSVQEMFGGDPKPLHFFLDTTAICLFFTSFIIVFFHLYVSEWVEVIFILFFFSFVFSFCFLLFHFVLFLLNL